MYLKKNIKEKYKMSSISAGLVNTTNLTVTGTQSGAVQATNFNTTNVNTQNVNVAATLKVGSASTMLYETGAKISAEYKTAVDNYCRTKAWDSSKGVIGSGPTMVLPYGNTMYVPCFSTELYKNGDTHINDYGIGSWRTMQPPNANTLTPILSMTKTVTAALYARFRTLGIITDRPTPLSSIWPVMNNITFQYPMYFDSSADAIAAGKQIVGQVPTTHVNGYGQTVPVQWKAGKYVAVGTPRTPYLEDALAENLGFIGGFDYFFLINAQAPGDNESVYFGGPRVLANLQGKKVSDYQKINIFRSDSSFNNVVNDPWTDTNNYFNKYVIDPSNKAMNVIIQGYDHGVFNYNISGSITTGALLKIYKNKYPSFTGSYYDMLKKELLDPIGSTMFTWMNDASDSRFTRLATSWTRSAKPDGFGGYVSDGSGWVVNNGIRNGPYSTRYAVISPNDISTSYAEGNIYSNHGSCLWRYFLNDTSGNVPQLHLGNIGLIATFEDYSKFGKLLMRDGVLPNGQRLIASKFLNFIKMPRGTASSWAESLCGQVVLNNAAGAYALGGASRGPTYNYIANLGINDPGNQQSAPAIFPGSTVYPAHYASFYDSPEDEFTWFGAAGDAFFVCPKKGVFFQYSMMDNEQTPEYKFGPEVENLAQEEYMHTGSVNIYQAP